MYAVQSREDLEQQSIETADTSEAVTFITFVQSLRRQMKPWEKQVEVRIVVHVYRKSSSIIYCVAPLGVFCCRLQMFKEGQRILERQRFQFPSSWLHSDNIEGEWSAFNDILRRKNDSIQTQVRSHVCT